MIEGAPAPAFEATPRQRDNLMNIVLGAGLALLASAAPSLAAAATLCTPGEIVVFSCGAGARTASVCASKDRGAMQYRFGSPDKLELVFPATPGRPAENFKGGWMAYSGGGGAFLRFSNGPFEYTIFNATGKWGADGGALDVAGVAIVKGGKEFSNFVCRNVGADVGELGPDFLDKMGLSPHDPDPDFAPPEAFFKK
jgi:hypothetical protein